MFLISANFVFTITAAHSSDGRMYVVYDDMLLRWRRPNTHNSNNNDNNIRRPSRSDKYRLIALARDEQSR